MKKQAGYAAITLLMFVVIASTIIIAATTIINTNNLSASKFSQSMETYYLAESAMEEGLLNYLRNPNYTGVTDQILGNGKVTITISADKKTMITTAVMGNFKRTLSTSLNYDTNLQINSWKEIF